MKQSQIRFEHMICLLWVQKYLSILALALRIPSVTSSLSSCAHNRSSLCIEHSIEVGNCKNVYFYGKIFSTVSHEEPFEVWYPFRWNELDRIKLILAFHNSTSAIRSCIVVGHVWRPIYRSLLSNIKQHSSTLDPFSICMMIWFYYLAVDAHTLVPPSTPSIHINLFISCFPLSGA